jgi:hypothetical protein
VLYLRAKIQTFLELPKEMPFFHITTKPPRKGWLRYNAVADGNGGKTGTSSECIISNTRHAVRDGEGGKADVRCEK